MNINTIISPSFRRFGFGSSSKEDSLVSGPSLDGIVSCDSLGGILTCDSLGGFVVCESLGVWAAWKLLIDDGSSGGCRFPIDALSKSPEDWAILCKSSGRGMDWIFAVGAEWDTSIDDGSSWDPSIIGIKTAGDRSFIDEECITEVGAESDDAYKNVFIIAYYDFLKNNCESSILKMVHERKIILAT